MRSNFVRASAVNSRARNPFLLASSIAALLLACSAGQALADVSGSIGNNNFFSGFTINEGQSGTAVLQLNMNAPQNASGGAGTTTNRINGGNPLTFASSGAVTTPTTPSVSLGGGGTTGNWSASFQYNLPGAYNISYGGTVSWQHTGNPSYSTGNDDGTGTNNVGGNINVTVNNVAPTITSANLGGVNGNATVGQGGSVSLNMTATDAGSQNTSFTVNGGGAGSAPGTPGSTRTSSTSSYSAVGVAPGVYAQTFQASDGITTASNGPQIRNITVTNVGPSITNAFINGTNGNVTVNEGAAVTLNMTATDPGNDIINFTINGGAAGSSPVQAGNSVRTSSNVSTPGGFLPGIYTETYLATDQYGGAAGPLTRVLTVANVGPTITGITPSQVIDPSLPFNFFATATDPGVALGDTLTYKWDWDDNGLYNDYTGASGTIPGNYYPLTNGTHKVSVEVTDSYGGVAHDSFTLTVIPEPTTLVMVGLGAAGIGFVARKRRRRK